MESLDDVIDAMIADKVIHRHRRKWLIALALVVVLAVVIFFTGGWKEKQGRKVDTMDAPVTIEAGRYEVGISKATIWRTPKTEYSPAKSRLEVELQLKNIDEEERASHRFDSMLLRWVIAGKDPVQPAGVSCKDEIGYVLVYGLPAETCIAKFDVSPNFSTDMTEIGILAETYKSDSGLFGATDKAYWQSETAVAVVRVPTTIETETDE
ncbi:hypothetical protein [Kribbella catacumbae]|uniref:hypothetical protein n=1 Tax=Kribbella catacumbae TaxID=460086 RepID=UPI0003719C33|nr:hypothetical protein [Kribbella catacumbae]